MAVQGEVPIVLGVVPIGAGLNLSLASSFSHRMRVWCHFESVAIITHPIIISKKISSERGNHFCATVCREMQSTWNRGKGNQGKEALVWTQVLHWCVFRDSGGGGNWEGTENK